MPLISDDDKFPFFYRSDALYIYTKRIILIDIYISTRNELS